MSANNRSDSRGQETDHSTPVPTDSPQLRYPFPRLLIREAVRRSNTLAKLDGFLESFESLFLLAFLFVCFLARTVTTDDRSTIPQCERRYSLPWSSSCCSRSFLSAAISSAESAFPFAKWVNKGVNVLSRTVSAKLSIARGRTLVFGMAGSKS